MLQYCDVNNAVSTDASVVYICCGYTGNARSMYHGTTAVNVLNVNSVYVLYTHVILRRI